MYSTSGAHISCCTLLGQDTQLLATQSVDYAPPLSRNACCEGKALLQGMHYCKRSPGGTESVGSSELA